MIQKEQEAIKTNMVFGRSGGSGGVGIFLNMLDCKHGCQVTDCLEIRRVEAEAGLGLGLVNI